MALPDSSADASYYVTAPLLWPLVLGLRALHLDEAAVLARVGLSVDALKSPDARVPATQAVAVMQAAVELSADPNLGLRLSQLYEAGVFTVLDYLAHSSSTLREAIDRMCRYERIHQNGWRTTLRVDGARATLQQEVLVTFAVPRQVPENSIANMLMIGRNLTGQRLIPNEVWFKHEKPSDTREHERVFGCPLRFSAACDALLFDAAWLELPLSNANPALAETLERHARELLARIARGDSLADRVRRQLLALLPDGSTGIDRVARELKISARTLQRRLHEEGTSQKELLEQLRIELSMRYLAEPTLGIEDVALMLGFSDSRAFRRAFKRWQGMSPTEHRAKHKA